MSVYDRAVSPDFLPLDGSEAMTGDLTVTSTGDAAITIEADTDNVSEDDNPSLIFKQDGGAVDATYGINSDNLFYGVAADGLTFFPGDTERLCVLKSTSATMTNSDSSIETSWTTVLDPHSWKTTNGITPDIAGWYEVSASVYGDDNRIGEWYFYISPPVDGVLLIDRRDSSETRRVATVVSGLVYVDGATEIFARARHFFTDSSNMNCDATLSARLVRRDR